ncbi:LamG-like jellyroll fold domain-containing protein [Streptomyces sp. NPDC002589]|uniref:LamG-like jellyroll fold domain-containing protein n=1 Tax=Streptomyces sp. NPDC002589 TaxID=3154420 RepID=UPI00333367DB
MTRRWSLIALIVALTVALTFVIIDINSAADSGKKKAPAAGADLRGVGWWPLHEKSGTVAADKAGRHDATVQGGTKWVDGPRGGALELDGSTGYADAGDPVLDTGRDYSVAAWVRLDNPGFRTAVSLEGQHGSVFYLQYSGYDQRFSLSFVNMRALAARVGPAVSGRWYHLVGTYRRTAGLLSLPRRW